MAIEAVAVADMQMQQIGLASDQQPDQPAPGR
jgi:hypothetical protein